MTTDTDRETLTDPGPKHSPEFEAFLRRTIGANDFSKLKPVTRLALHHQFVDEQKNPPKSAADKTSEALLARYGSADDVLAKATAVERLGLHHALADAPKSPSPIKHTYTPTQTAALNTIRDPSARLAAEMARREYATIATSNREFDQTRAKALLQRYGKDILAA